MEDVKWDRYEGSFGLAPLKQEGGWFIGPPSTPFLWGPPGTRPEDHPDYKQVMKEMYGRN